MSQLKKYFSTIQNCEQKVLENQKPRHSVKAGVNFAVI